MDAALSAQGIRGALERKEWDAQRVLEDVLAELGGAGWRRGARSAHGGRSEGRVEGRTHLKMGLSAPFPFSWRSCLDLVEGAAACWRLKRSEVARGTAGAHEAGRGEQSEGAACGASVSSLAAV